MPDSDPGLTIARRIRDTAAIIEAELEAELRPLRLTAAQYGVLRRIAEQPGRSSAELARTVRVSAQSMHELVTGLERQKWIVRTPGDGRVLRIRLTPPGRALLRRGRARADHLSQRTVAGFTRAEQDQLAALLDQVERNLG